ncbi:hypothetical protein PHABIO_180 [Pseudomonas phage Phabio]|uniref:Uncharacterized protein n=1 Tax=Pseudomonas phage Phabio TaxID=2006668 RepID=A0A1Y0STK2_9CAUD|nr:hypothetical protein MZD05_gp180 [Pseudomonas phage Phabio]ARV76811.1 hypothetical protein PHABIO_180 [Pseudomonas phage Phabio]
MGEYKAPNGTRSFEPDDTETEFYIDANQNPQRMSTILDLARIKWGQEVTTDDLIIEPEHIHTQCLGHDCYDGFDYTNYLRIEYAPQP